MEDAFTIPGLFIAMERHGCHWFWKKELHNAFNIRYSTALK